MGYFGGPNKALTNPCFKRPKLVSFVGGEENVRREEENRKRKKKGDSSKAQLRYGN